MSNPIATAPSEPNSGNQPSSSTQRFLSGKLNQVDIRKIEKELQSLWQLAAGSESQGEQSSPSVTRACVMNFILYSEQEDSLKAACDLLDEITMRHPCRAILAVNTPSTESSLEAWVSARCHISDTKTMKQICCEQITVRGQGVESLELCSVVLPLIVPDLPVVMRWQPSKLNRARMSAFLDAVDKIIFDSGSEPENLQFFQELLFILGKVRAADHGRTLLCTDLNWRRSLPWREALALAFDRRHSDVTPQYLAGIKSVEIRYGLPDHGLQGDPSPSSSRGLINQGLLVAGWLASTLKWVLKRARETCEATEIVYESKAGEIVVRLSGVKAEEADPGDIGSITIACQKPEAVVITALQQRGMPGIGVTCMRNGANRLDPSHSCLFEMEELSEERLIDKELAVLSIDRSFMPAVQATVAVLQALVQGAHSESREI